MTKLFSRSFPSLLIWMVLFMVAGSIGTLHYVRANAVELPRKLDIDPNFGIKNKVIEFFESNDAHEMVSIVKCESRFRHYGNDGALLKNKEGSSAIGVAQILTSVHPDPKVLTKYNRLFDMDLEVSDFDITTLEGNLGYALVLYKVRGTKDWECSKKFRF